jgi:hypothetical protein
MVTDQPLATTGAKQPGGETTDDPLTTTGTFCTGGKQPDINNTSLNNNYLGAADVGSSPTVSAEEAGAEAHLPDGTTTPTSRTTYGDTREGGVEDPTPMRKSGKWMPSEAALATAHDNVELQDIALSITHYRIRVAELGKQASSSEWLRWLIADEKKLRQEELEKAKANGQKKPWFAVAGD